MNCEPFHRPHPRLHSHTHPPTDRPPPAPPTHSLTPIIQYGYDTGTFLSLHLQFIYRCSPDHHHHTATPPTTPHHHTTPPLFTSCVTTHAPRHGQDNNYLHSISFKEGQGVIALTKKSKANTVGALRRPACEVNVLSLSSREWQLQ